MRAKLRFINRLKRALAISAIVLAASTFIIGACVAMHALNRGSRLPSSPKEFLSPEGFLRIPRSQSLPLSSVSSSSVSSSHIHARRTLRVNMTDNVERVEGTSSRGADWEVVSLTASAYAAAPGPNEFNHNDESEEQEDITKLESSSALLMSGHFVFPPSEHENLPVVPDSSKNYSETEVHTPGAVSVDDGFDSLGKERQQTESNDDLHSFEFYDKESQTTTCEMVFEEGTGFQKLNLAGLEQGMLDDSESVAVHSETHKSDTEFEAEGSLDVIMDSPRGHTKLCEDEVDLPNLPCQVWWKRHATSLYCHAKESNTFWSVVVAAAVMGVVIMGRQWQRDKWQLHQIKWRFSIRGERMIKMFEPTGRFKNVVVGGHHQHCTLVGGVGASASI
ncbi:hypothetical protein OPV22_030393 [Ensete ventricosum]|uniref:Uncharacterized protein n=1 Tax=Ensete ventricosum TaxID=4639 RepID=A0AAV8QE07_ENSVE|nr:hypothetical protein OPV22_030393 [Ensete ventricosum]